MVSADAADVGAGASTRVSKTGFSGTAGWAKGCCWPPSAGAGAGAGAFAGTSSGSGATGSEGSAPGAAAGAPEETDEGSGGGSVCAPVRRDASKRAGRRLVRTDEGKDIRACTRRARKDGGMKLPGKTARVRPTDAEEKRRLAATVRRGLLEVATAREGALAMRCAPPPRPRGRRLLPSG